MEMVDSDRVQCLFLLADNLRQVVEPLSLAQAVEYFLAQDLYRAAQRASANDPPLREQVEADLRRRREQFRNDHAELFRRAEVVSGHDEYVGEYLSEIAKALDETDFPASTRMLSDLECEVRHVEIRRDPERQELVNWLRGWRRHCRRRHAAGNLAVCC